MGGKLNVLQGHFCEEQCHCFQIFGLLKPIVFLIISIFIYFLRRIYLLEPFLFKKSPNSEDKRFMEIKMCDKVYLEIKDFQEISFHSQYFLR